MMWISTDDGGRYRVTLICAAGQCDRLVVEQRPADGRRWAVVADCKSPKVYGALRRLPAAFTAIWEEHTWEEQDEHAHR